jgi:hypothetical protein
MGRGNLGDQVKLPELLFLLKKLAKRGESF